MEYGLIGSKLGHSYSKIIHERLCGYKYELHPLPTEAEARAFLEARPFRAINVTIPYKRLVMEYCDEIDPRAAAIGAVTRWSTGAADCTAATPTMTGLPTSAGAMEWILPAAPS